MRLSIDEDELGWNDPGWALMLFGAVAALVFIYFKPLVWLLPDCVFHSLSGFPCPACGCTRAFSALIDGDFLGAIRLQPLFVAVCLFCAARGVRALLARIAGKRIYVELTDQDRFLIRCAIIVLIVVNWAYLVNAGI
jgi:hypothetical protein